MLAGRGLKAKYQVPLKVECHGKTVGELCVEILVDRQVILELKAVKALTPEYEAPLFNDLKATGIKVGLLINFGRPRLQWKRLVY